MSAYYYVNRNAQDSARNEHEVHKGYNCPHPPNPENQVALGQFNSCREALAVAKKLGYSPVDGCYYCNPTCHRT